jgi:hypothetical protein
MSFSDFAPMRVGFRRAAPECIRAALRQATPAACPGLQFVPYTEATLVGVVLGSNPGRRGFRVVWRILSVSGSSR